MHSHRQREYAFVIITGVPSCNDSNLVEFHGKQFLKSEMYLSHLAFLQNTSSIFITI
jgi:hypothetical protein